MDVIAKHAPPERPMDFGDVASALGWTVVNTVGLDMKPEAFADMMDIWKERQKEIANQPPPPNNVRSIRL